MITTPSNVSSLLEAPALGQNKPPFNTNLRASSPPFEERALPGQGRFLVANRTLHRGDLLFTHTPLLYVSGELSELSNEAFRHELLHRAVDNLPEASRELFWAQAAHQGDAVDSAQDRVDTNGFAFEIDGEEYSAISPEIAVSGPCDAVDPNALTVFRSA